MAVQLRCAMTHSRREDAYCRRQKRGETLRESRCAKTPCKRVARDTYCPAAREECTRQGNDFSRDRLFFQVAHRSTRSTFAAHRPNYRERPFGGRVITRNKRGDLRASKRDRSYLRTARRRLCGRIGADMTTPIIRIQFDRMGKDVSLRVRRRTATAMAWRTDHRRDC